MNLAPWAADTLAVSASLSLTSIAFSYFMDGISRLSKTIIFWSFINNLPKLAAALKKEEDGSIKFNIGNT